MKKLSVSLKESRFVDLINKKFTGERRKEDGIKVKTCLNTEIFLKNPESKYDDLIEDIIINESDLKIYIGKPKDDDVKIEDLKNFKIPYKYLVYEGKYGTSLMCEFAPYSECEDELADYFEIYDKSDYDEICRSISEKLKENGELLECIPKEKYVESYVIGDYRNPHLSADRYTGNYHLLLIDENTVYNWYCKYVNESDDTDYILMFKNDIIYKYPELEDEDFIVWSYTGYGCNIAIPLNINNLNHINEYYKYTQNWFKL